MSEYKQTALVFVSTLAVSVLGLTLAAQAQTITSPFAKKNKKQAWETSTTTTTTTTTNSSATTPQPYQYPYGSTSSSPTVTTAPASSPYASGGSPVPVISANTAPVTSAPQSSYSYTLPKPSAPSSATGTTYASGSYVPASPTMSSGGSPYPNTYSGGTTAPQASGTYRPQIQTGGQLGGQAGASYDYPSYNRAPSVGQSPAPSGAYYPGRTNGGQQKAPALRGPVQQGAQGTYYPQQAQTSYPTPNQYPGQNPGGQRSKPSLTQKLGLNNIDIYYEGYVGGGAAGTYYNMLDTPDHEWREDFVLDGLGLVEVSAITQGGLEYGVAAEIRGQYDPYRRGFGGRVGDCPPTEALCASVNDGGTDFALRGHTSRFYANGASDAKDFHAQLEGAHIFLRSAYGDVTVGRDDGAAYLFSLGAPSLLNVGASNSPVDYTGLDAVKTVNDASGFSEKVTYTSPRLLGDTVGAGVQIGVSYALDAEACGVDYCVRGNDDEPAGVLAPELDDILEVGLAIDRKFDNGLSVEATATYAMGSQQSALAAFDDLKSLGLAMELGYGDFVLGGSYLKSNNALSDGDYEAMDIGLTWQPSKFGMTVGYGHATDDNIGLTSDQAVAGISYDINEMFRVSTGVQYVNRDVNVFDAATGLVSGRNENATSGFVEGRIKF